MALPLAYKEETNMSEQKYRVYNRCKYDIGVSLLAGHDIVIKAGSFQMLSVDDINYIESICRVNKFFSQRMLVPVDETGKEIPMAELGVVPNAEKTQHYDDKEIAAILKQPVKKIEAWLAEIEDPAEFHAIASVAKTLDLSASKLKVLKEKMPAEDFIG